MTYTALAAETEVIENLREVLDGLQVGWGYKPWAVPRGELAVAPYPSANGMKRGGS